MEGRIRQALERLFDKPTADAARLTNLGGHASLRIYWRIHLPHGSWPREENVRMAMVLPEGADPLKSEEGQASDAPKFEELPFVDVHRLLVALDQPVPAIDLIDMELGVLILEDLGDELFETMYLNLKRDFGTEPANLRVPTEQLYHKAINLLVDLQRSYSETLANPKRELPESIALGRSFNRELLRWELDHYKEWGLQAQYGEDILEDAAGDLDRLFDQLVDDLLEQPRTLVLRDYQSRNLLNKHGGLHLIDFQDALMGPMIYDLVALLRDSYIELPFVTVRRLVDHYTKQGFAAGLEWCDDPDAVLRAFCLQTVQRKLKDAGRFIYIDRVKGNPSFLDYYKPSIGYVRQALEMLEDDYLELAHLLAEFEPAWHDD